MESGQTTGREAEAIVMESIEPLLDAGADTIVLGCTHYPFISETINKVSEILVPDRKITLIDPAPAVARHLNEVMTEEGIIRHDGFTLSLYASGDDTLLKRMAANL